MTATPDQITEPRMFILRFLAQAEANGNGVGFNDLDFARGTSHPTSREHFEALRKLKLVSRKPGKLKSLRITQAGRELLAAADSQ